MLSSPASETLAPPSGNVRFAGAFAQVQRVRPGLAADSPECRAGVVLLLAREAGFNVDRLVLRTGYPRSFVSLVVRRLADNAFWLGGEFRCDWSAQGAAAPNFWLDVDVALGRRLRRVAGESFEWAPLGEWVKEFEYRSAESALSGPICNAYRAAPEHPVYEAVPLSEAAPEPLRLVDEFGAEAYEEEDEDEAEDADDEALEEDEAEEEAAAPAPRAPVAAHGMLLGDWASANWLG